MYPSRVKFPWNLEQANVFIEISRNDAAGMWHLRKAGFENLCENGDVSHSETLCMLIKS